MKMLQAYIKPHRVDEVMMALHHVEGLTGVSVFEVRGWGRAKMDKAQHQHREQVSDFEPHVKLELFCSDEVANEAVLAIQNAAFTGLAGDGKIYLSPFAEAIRIGTGERGSSAI